MTAAAETNRLDAFLKSKPVQWTITTLIVLNAITLGMMTSADIRESYGTVLLAFDQAVLYVFVVELALKLIAQRQRFFTNGWNWFDTVIIAISLMPDQGPLSVLRALRIFRALRLISVVPQMRMVVQALLAAIPGLLSIISLITLIFYVGAVLTTNLYGATFPDWFGSIGKSMYTLFQVMTLESWSMGIVRPVMDQHATAWIFFIPFILITTFSVLNLFIGIIVEAMQSVHTSDAEIQATRERQAQMDKLEAIEAQLEALRSELGRKEN